MIRRIIIEVILFLIPFAIFFAYRAASKDMSIRDRWPLTTLVLIGGVLAVAGLLIVPLLQPSDQGKCYQAARYVDGQLIPGGLVDCDQVGVPQRDSDPLAPPPPRPVAPRDLERER